jgi:ribA/ribD-fused uncharacterized protein
MQNRDKNLETTGKIIGFYEREFYCFSNFSSFAVDRRGREWPTSEHAYQAAHFVNTDEQLYDKIFNCRSAHEAYQLANENEDKEDPNFNNTKVQIMEEIVRLKLEQNPYIQKKLLQTDDLLIVEDSPKDNFWGWGPNHDGRNELGKIWMLARPPVFEVFSGFVPTSDIIRNPDMLYIALGIIGATVMPHNLYLHSSIVQTRKYGDSEASRSEATSFAVLDSTVALTSALFINGAILVVAAATFHGTGYEHVADISDAYKLLAPMLGTSLASTLFALGLLFSGQNATLTGTLAGQIVMEGFLNIRLRPWLRRLVTRGIAIAPALVVIVLYGDHAAGSLLILSQVILSLQLPFAIFPLILSVSDRRIMGKLVIGKWLKLLAWPSAVLIALLNVWLLGQVIAGLF